MGAKKIYPQLTPFDGGLNLSDNPLSRAPNQWVNCQNAMVAKPYGFKTGQSEQNHVAQSRPPMKLSLDSAFDVSVAATPTEIKPLVGATQAAADDQPNQWQSLAKCILTEGWTVTGSYSSVSDTITEVAGLTKSDGNNIALQLSTEGSDGSGSTYAKSLQTTLAKPLNPGIAGNNTTMLYIDYHEMYWSHFTGPPVTDTDVINKLVLRIGVDAGNYLEFNLPFGSQASPPATTYSSDGGGGITNHYGTYRHSVNLRSYDSKTGTKNIGEILNNLVWFQVYAEATGALLLGSSAAVEYFTIDHIRLDVDYLGFFGDFKSGQPYKQVTACDFDLESALFTGTSSLSGGAYPERRLSIGNGCAAFEIDEGSTIGTLDYTFPAAMDFSGVPTYLMVDYRVENHASLSTLNILLGSTGSPSGHFTWTIPISADGNGTAYILASTLPSTGSPNLNHITYVEVDVTSVASPGTGTNALRVYVSNLRFAPYTNAPGFPARTGNIRDVFLYDPTDIGEDTRFVMACGDALFVGDSLLGAESWYVGGGFTNWNNANPQDGLIQRFVFATAPNPNFIYSTSLNADVSAGANSIVVISTVNLQAGQQIVIDPNGVNPEINYVDASYSGGTTIPLKTALAYDHNGTTTPASVTWENFAEPKTIALFVNGSDGFWRLDVFSYPLSGGGTYQYPRVQKLDPTAFSTIMAHLGYIVLAGDPNNPDRLVFTESGDNTVIPAESFLELPIDNNANTGDRITALRSYEQFLIVFRRSDIAIMYGDSLQNFDLRFTSSSRGALGQNHTCLAGRRIFFFAHDGVYEFVNFTSQKISDNINVKFQTNDFTRMECGFIFYNPLREILVVVIPFGSGEYNHDPFTAPSDIFTYSLEKNAWGWFYASSATYDPRFGILSGVYYGGGNGAPSIYFSSVTMVEWDNGPDALADQFSISCAPNGFGSPFQEKIFDKLYTYLKNFGSTTPGTDVKFTTGYNALTQSLLANNTQWTTDGDGMLELFCPSGTHGKAGAPLYDMAVADWTAPIQMQGYGVSYFPGEDL